jgi:hypothetical protein
MLKSVSMGTVPNSEHMLNVNVAGPRANINVEQKGLSIYSPWNLSIQTEAF